MDVRVGRVYFIKSMFIDFYSVGATLSPPPSHALFNFKPAVKLPRRRLRRYLDRACKSPSAVPHALIAYESTKEGLAKEIACVVIV